MRLHWVVALFLPCALSMDPLQSHPNLRTKFEYKYSFKPPYVANSKGNIHFWDYGGDAIPSDEQVRVCPSLHDRRGWVWTKNQYSRRNWMFDASMRITGKSSLGADGLAFWFTKEKGASGPMFGNVEHFSGLAVVFDSFDNNAQGDSPKIQLFLSDRTLRYDHSSDGQNQEACSCMREFRNKPYPVKLKVTFIDKTLQVWLHTGTSSIEHDYELCCQVEDPPNIPESGYFGISAATGGLSDDHDVQSFVVHSILSLDEYQKEMKKKFDEQLVKETQEQYEKMQSKYQEKYDKSRGPAPDWQAKLEMEENIRYIYEDQRALGREVRALSVKLDNLQASGIRATGSAGGVSDQTLAALEGRLSHQLSEMQSVMVKSAQSGGSGPITASEQMQPIYDLKAKLQELETQLQSLHRTIQEQSGKACPPPLPADGTCLSTWFFMVVAAVQFIAVVGIMIYHYNHERNAKKFF